MIKRAGADPALDGAVILFQNVVEILHRSMPAILLQSLLVFSLHNRGRVSGIVVGVDDSRRRMVCSAALWLESVRQLLGNLI
jgi:hypothetical protein